MTRGKHTSKSAERIWKSKPGVSSSDLNPRRGATEQENSPGRRRRLHEPLNDTERVEGKPREETQRTPTAMVVVKVEVEVEPMNVRI